MNRRGRPARTATGRRAPKAPRAPKAAPARRPEPVEPLPPLRLGFARGVAPSKWAERWARAVPEQPLELVPLGIDEIESGRGEVDVLLERVAPAEVPSGFEPEQRTRHALHLYDEAVALVVGIDHELAERGEVDLDDLALAPLLDHPDHQRGWPAPQPWLDPTWAPADAAATLELVSTGLGGVLMALPLARHLAGKRTHAVIPVASGAVAPLPATAIWASWAVDRDAHDVQRLIGVLRGRSSRSSR